MELLISLLSLPLCITWAYRGGSLYRQQHWPLRLGTTRWLTLLATPLFMTLAFVAGLWPNIDWPDAVALALGFIAFFAAQADGWGRQMDLGRDRKPDDETGHRLRDLVWSEKSSFARDLCGLHMRFAQFIPAAVCFGYIDFWLSLPTALLTVGAPWAWVLESKLFYERGRPPPVPFVELLVGAALAASTAASATLAM